MRRISTAVVSVFVAMASPHAGASEPNEAPVWLVSMASVSAGMVAVSAIGAGSTAIHLRTRLRPGLAEAIARSREDTSPANDIADDSNDPCSDARASVLGDGRVTNAAVTKMCNRIDGAQTGLRAWVVLAGVGVVSAAVFTGLLVARRSNRWPRRDRLARIGVGASTTAASITFVGRF